MREILFRGKRVDNGEWAEGFYYIATSGYAGSDEVIGKPCYMITTGRWQASGAYGERNELAEHKVIPESIGQFTSLTDKNGKRIFEGDIVEYNEELGEIAYHESEAMFVVEFDTWLTDFDHLYGKDLEVIGNIHDNPEMMEAE